MILAFNSDTCSGCKACELVCSLQNLKTINPSRAMLHVYGKFPEPGRYFADICDQCGECAKACPQEAIVLIKGTWRIDKKKCDGCLACVSACPVNVMMVDDDNMPYKCINCRQCAEVCPRDALTFQ
ncbi:MAG: 4Fe-4S binding protein [Desulfotignum sp.]|nr:4Fe-4S binding protein [Desulfotignum sp.]MCF8126824.1 4Fe-4S binding protein [Desulfotignum sp.]